MFRLLLACMLVAGTSAASFAQTCGETMANRWKLDVFGGYATFNMTDVNDDYAAISANPPTKIENGWEAGGEFLYRVSRSVALGPRVEYLKANQGKANVMGVDIKEDVSLVPVMAGARFALKKMSERPGKTFCENCGLSLGAFVGWATGWGQTVSGATIKYAGSGFAGDVLLGWEHRIVSDLRLLINAGYRYAIIPEMKTTEDYPALGAAKGATIIDHAGRTLKYDFSGLIATVGLGFSF